jgi:6,7-dimethyl-8-ribityllumazine synthase
VTAAADGEHDGHARWRTVEGRRSAPGLRVAIVVSRFNDFVTERLLSGALEGLAAAEVHAVDVSVIRVPGAFEIPLAARRAASSARFDAVVCLGCLIRGATPHFDFIASAVAHGLTEAASASGVPVTFGVLTTNSAEEALERTEPGPSNKGWEAAAAAVEMATLLAALDAPGGEAT